MSAKITMVGTGPSRRGCVAALLAAALALATSRAVAQDQHPSDSSEHRPDVPMILVGSGLFGVPYFAGVGYASFRSSSPRGMERRALHVPVVGPLLAIRGIGCDDTADSSCSTSGGTAVWSLLVLDSVVQATGVVLLAVGLANHEERRARTPSARIAVVPAAIGANRCGASAVGSF